MLHKTLAGLRMWQYIVMKAWEYIYIYPLFYSSTVNTFWYSKISKEFVKVIADYKNFKPVEDVWSKGWLLEHINKKLNCISSSLVKMCGINWSDGILHWILNELVG